MKITNLNLTNFRSHVSTAIQLERYNFVVGGNGSGKSSVAQAIEWLLTGICDVTDQGGKGADDLVRAGQAECSVEGTFDVSGKQMTLERTRERGGGSDVVVTVGKQTINGPVAKDFLAKIAPASVLSAVLSATNFVELKPDDQKRLLATVLADEGIPVPEEFLEAFGIGLPKTFRASIADLDKAYKRAFTERTDRRRVLKALGELAPPEGDAPDVEKIKKQIAALTGDRDVLLADKAKGSTEGERLRLEQSLANAESAQALKQAILDERRAKIQEQIDACKPLTFAQEKELKKVIDKCPERESITAAIRMKKTEQEETKNRLARLASAECPMCLRKMTQADLQAMIKAINAHIETLDTRIGLAEKEDVLRDAAEDARKRVSESIAEQHRKEELAEELNQVHEKADPSEVERLEKELAALPKSVDTSAIEDKIAAVDRRLSLGQQVLINATTWTEKMRQYKRASAQKERDEKDIAHIEKFLEFAEPDGARKAAVGGKIGAFTEALNKSLAQFGFEAAFTLDPFLMRVGKSSGGLKLELHQLSVSEKFRFATAFQIALAQVTEINLVVIDFADMLEPRSRKELASMLMLAGIDQAIVCSTQTEVPAAVPKGVKFFVLRNEADVTELVA